MYDDAFCMSPINKVSNFVSILMRVCYEKSALDCQGKFLFGSKQEQQIKNGVYLYLYLELFATILEEGKGVRGV